MEDLGMEESVQVANKSSRAEQAYQFLEALQRKHTPGSTTLYVRRNSYSDPRFLDLDLEKLRYLEKDGAVKMSDYLRLGQVDPNVIAIDLLPKAVQFLEGCKVTIEEHTDRKIIIDPEEPTWQATKRTRDFVRTERGNMIVTMCPEALESDIRGHLAALRDGNIPQRTRTLHRIWLSYELNWRWNDISPELRHEMEDYRDLQVTRKRKR
jgi:hypothetical protein